MYVYSIYYVILRPCKYIHQVLSGDAKAIQLMQVITQVNKNPKLRKYPPILFFPLGSKANISFSLHGLSKIFHLIFYIESAHISNFFFKAHILES